MLNRPQKLFYQIDVHTKSFKHKSLPIKQRIQNQYLPKYWKQLNFDQKNIKPNQQDRLSLLTTKQIDRIIDMERIKYILNGKKNGNKQMYLDKYKNQENKHTNVFRANFLSKINKIAIQRNIFTEKAEGFEEIYGQYNPESIRRRELDKQQENIKYVKQYKSNKKKTMNKLSLQQMKNKNQFAINDQKSISSIDYERNLQDFQDHLKQNMRNKNKFSNKNNNSDNKNLLYNKRWFDGMSTHYVQKKNFFNQADWSNQHTRSMDISSMMQKKRNFFNQKKKSKILACRRVKTQFDVMSSMKSDKFDRQTDISSKDY